MDDQVSANIDDRELSKVLAEEPINGWLGLDHCWIRSDCFRYPKLTGCRDHTCSDFDVGTAEDVRIRTAE
jgi:hypothetical protein